MTNSVVVTYPLGSTRLIRVLYSIDDSNSIQTVNCAVEGGDSLSWLQLRKFSVSAIRQKQGYVLLFNEVNNSKNLDTSLFIDMVYSSIMGREHHEYV